MNAAAGSPVWVDLGTSNLESAKKFYSTVFGWTFADGGEELGHYHTITAEDGSLVGGMMQNFEPSDPVAWGVYFGTDDIQASGQKITEAGGKLLMDPMPVADLGTMVIATAPSGAEFGLWQPGRLQGFSMSNITGMPGFFDSPTSDFAADTAFYEAALGWDVRRGEGEMSGFASVGPIEEASVGLFDAAMMFPEGSRSLWRTFFNTESMEQTVRAVEKAGGTVTDGPESEDGGMSIIATVRDPEGATFLVVQGIEGNGTDD